MTLVEIHPIIAMHKLNKNWSTKRLTISQVIEKANLVHNHKYKYTLDYYKNNQDLITAICETHGEFRIKIRDHLRGYGCGQCCISHKDTLESFIRKANIKHNYFYKYDKAIYINSKIKLIITCPIHGDFLMAPASHIRGGKCPKCSLQYKLSVTEIINRCNKIHNNKYQYKLKNNNSLHEKMCIICSEHGEFWQRIIKHLSGRGCYKCTKERLKNNPRYTINDFIQKAQVIHGNKYDYSKAIYINAKTKICIICPIHGEFWQTPDSHLSSAGCPVCSSSKGEIIIRKGLDKYKINYIQEYRIPNQKYMFYYDFYLPDHNLLIEFHGGQHFKYIPFFHRNGEDDLLKQQERDGFKKALAKELGYRFLEVNYKQLKVYKKEIFEKLILKMVNSGGNTNHHSH